MCQSCEDVVQDIWRQLEVGQVLRTPDIARGREFEVVEVRPRSISIASQGIEITRAAFVEAIHYLKSFQHEAGNPCAVGSSNIPVDSGPLCSVTRAVNNNVRCINYILPVLEAQGAVAIDHSRPNSTWFLRV